MNYELGIQGIVGQRFFQRKNHFVKFRVVSWNVSLGYVCGLWMGEAWKKEGATSQQRLH